MFKEITIEKIQKSDHDLLIRLESKVDGLIDSIKEIKEGTGITLLDHDNRIRIIERVHEEINPKEITKEFRITQQQVRDFGTVWKIIITIAGIIGGLVGFILSILINSLQLFRK